MANNYELQTNLVARVRALEQTVAALARRLDARDKGQPEAGASPFSDRVPATPDSPPNATSPRHPDPQLGQSSVAPTGSRAPAVATVPSWRPPSATGESSSLGSSPHSGTTSRPHAARSSIAPADPGQWVNRLGIALLLIGAAFGFKYSIDHAWIGPTLRVCLGLGLSAVLLTVARQIRNQRHGLSRLLGGGAIASAYLSIFAAYQFYALVPHGVAIVGMSLVTTLAFAMALRDDDAIPATFATAMGLATPLLLSDGGGSAAGLTLYASMVLGAAASVFAKCGWRVLMWAMTAGGWLLFTVAAAELGRRSSGNAVALQMGVLFLAATTWGLASAREVLSAANSERWPPTKRGFTLWGSAATSSDEFVILAHQLALTTPVLLLFLSGMMWDFADAGSGRMALLLAAIWSAAAWLLHRTPDATALRDTHISAAAVMVAFAANYLLGDSASRIAMSAEALALLWLGARSERLQPAILGQILLAVVSLLTTGHLFEELDRKALGFSAAELADLIVVLTVAAASRLRPHHEQPAYLLAALAGFFLWLQVVLHALPNGELLVTAAWFATVIAVIVVGLRLDDAKARQTGAAAMALTMGKLFAFDLATVDAGWRIVAFLGFGCVLLGLGYAFPQLWHRGGAQGDEPRVGPGGSSASA